MSADRRRPDQIPPQSNFAKTAGIRIVSMTPALAVCEMPVTEALANRNGVLHGGALMTLADNAAGSVAFANIPANKTNTTVESKTNFLRAARIGDVVTARCEAIHIGRTTHVLHTTMTRGDGKKVAVTTQTHLIIDWSE